MCKVNSKLRIDGFPAMFREPVNKRTRGGGPETREEKEYQAAVVASMETAASKGSPAIEPVILEGQRVPPVSNRAEARAEARAAPPRPVPRAPRPAASPARARW